MAASGNKLKSNPSESKGTTVEVAPPFLATQIPLGVTGIMFDYAFDADDECETGDAQNSKKESVWLKQSDTTHTFLGISCASHKKIITLAKYSGPFDQLEECITQAHMKKEPHLQATLKQAINIAVRELDLTLCDRKGNEIDKGMAEKLLELHAKFFPHHQAEALEQARRAAPLEDKTTKDQREKANVFAVHRLFAAFIKNDKDALPAAINEFKTFVHNLKPAVITDNRYYLNMLHLVFVAYNTLELYGERLPRIDGDEGDGKWDGKLADQFCIEIIGAVSQSEMPPRVKEILKSGVMKLYNGKSPTIPPRSLDISGALFRGDGTDNQHGINSYCDTRGRRSAPRAGITASMGRLPFHPFKVYYEHLYSRSQNLLNVDYVTTASLATLNFAKSI